MAEYDRLSGLSITGGYVYRGQDQPSLLGIYFFADYVTGRIWGLRSVNDQWESKLLLDSTHNVSSFGEDEAGNSVRRRLQWVRSCRLRLPAKIEAFELKTRLRARHNKAFEQPIYSTVPA